VTTRRIPAPNGLTNLPTVNPFLDADGNPLDFVSSSDMQSAINSRTIESFGAVGDDSNNDTSAFRAFNDWALTQTGLVELNFGRGKTYRSTDNTWSYNIPLLRVNGNGSTLKNTAPLATNYNFGTCSAFNMRNAVSVSPTLCPRSYIANVAAGATTVTLLTSAETDNFDVGEWVCVASHGTFPDGFPPSFRKFDYVEIASKTSTTLTFTRPLRYNYRIDDIYTSAVADSGKAAVYQIEAASLWNIDHEYNDIFFETPGQTQKDGDYVICSGRKVVLNRCTGYAINPTAAEYVEFNQVTALADSEFDKVVVCVKDTGSTWLDLSSAVSIEQVSFEDSTIESFTGFSPRNLSINRCKVKGSIGIGGRGLVDSLTIRNSSLVYDTFYSHTLSQNASVTIGSGSVTYSAGTLTIPANHTNIASFLGRLYVGLILHKSTDTGGTWVASRSKAIVKSITCDGTNASIVLSVNFTPANGDILAILPEPIKTTIENTTVNGVRIDRNCANTGNVKIQNWSPDNVAAVNAEAFLQPSAYPRVFGFIKSITINVKRAYTGSISGNVALTIQRYTPTSGAIVAVDLKTVGSRKITRELCVGLTGTNGESAAFNLGQTDADYTALAALSCFYDFRSDTVAQLPLVDIEIECDPLEMDVALSSISYRGLTATPAIGSITGLGTNVATALAVNANASGGFVRNGGSGSFLFTASTSTDKVVIVKGTTSQSGTLQEWRNVSDTVLVSISAGGTILATGTIQGGTVTDGFITMSAAQINRAGNVEMQYAGAGSVRLFGNTAYAVNFASGTGVLTVIGGLGYGAGGGGTVTQVTSRTTGVTLNKPSGLITLVSTAGSASYQTCVVTNSTVTAKDSISISQVSGTDIYVWSTKVAAGSFSFTFATTGGTTTESPSFQFNVIKGATT
jgi:hypothetical protein